MEGDLLLANLFAPADGEGDAEHLGGGDGILEGERHEVRDLALHKERLWYVGFMAVWDKMGSDEVAGHISLGRPSFSGGGQEGEAGGGRGGGGGVCALRRIGAGICRQDG